MSKTLISVELEGTTALLQHAFQTTVESSTRRVHIEERVPRDEAQAVAYMRSNGVFYMPSTWILGALTEAGGAHKARGSRKSLKYVVPGAVMIPVPDLDLHVPHKPNEKITSFEVDGRPVTIPATKGRIMRYRPRFDRWGVSFNLRINTGMIDANTVRQLLAEAGESQGVGDFRPSKRGPFGQFAIVKWVPVEIEEAREAAE